MAKKQSAAEVSITDAIGLLMAKHGSLRAVARVLSIDHAYLFRLLKGEKVNPGPQVLRKLRLRKVVVIKYVPDDKACAAAAKKEK
jgi:hypothetical protein